MARRRRERPWGAFIAILLGCLGFGFGIVFASLEAPAPSARGAAPDGGRSKAAPTDGGKVYRITGRNYDYLVDKGKPWMMVVSASWCSHCKELTPVWDKLAAQLEGRVRVGRIEGTEEEVLVRRFGVASFPTIFHIDRYGALRPYGTDRPRDLESLVAFAIEEYLDYEPLPWYHTPHSWAGGWIKAFHEAPMRMQAVYTNLHEHLGMPDVLIILMGLVLPMCVGVGVLGVLDHLIICRL